MTALVGAFNQEKALLGAFSVIVKTDCGTDGSFYSTSPEHRHTWDTGAGGSHRTKKQAGGMGASQSRAGKKTGVKRVS